MASNSVIAAVVVVIVLVIVGIILAIVLTRSSKKCSEKNPTGTCPSGQECKSGKCSEPYTCSTSNLTGTCPSGQNCIQGKCSSYTCAPSMLTGTCPSGASCIDGTCHTCSPTTPTGTCPTGKLCISGTCHTCTPSNFNGSCPADKICDKGECKTISTDPCEPKNPLGRCALPTERCIEGFCGTCGPNNMTGTCPTGKKCIKGECHTCGEPPGTVGTCPATYSCIRDICYPAAAGDRGDRIYENQYIRVKEELRSPRNPAGDYFTMTQNRDGRIIVYHNDQLWWASRAPAYEDDWITILNGDGNLCTYGNKQREPIWCSNITQGPGNYALIMQKDGTLVVYRTDGNRVPVGTAIWSARR